MEHKILYRQTRSLRLGDTQRFKIHFTPHAEGDEVVIPPTLWVKVKNLEPVSKRAIYLAGPYILYVDCRQSDYDPNVKYFVTADQPVFEPQLLPGQSFYVQLSCHTLKKDYSWIVDVVSQIIFNTKITIDFEIMVGTSKKVLHEASHAEKHILHADHVGTFHPLLNVTEWDTRDLWNLPVLSPGKPKHLVILTHGLHSNSSADMLYLKEQIDRMAKKTQTGCGEETVVKAFFDNGGKTERGIKYLGSRVAEYIVELVTENEMLNNGQVTKISFIGHSLGGCVQVFVIAYLRSNFPWFFETIKPINFVAIASPLLGVANENPLYVKVALSAGVVGKTGQELGLKYLENNSKPLLLLLPSGLAHRTLKQFKRRTVYANALNDGIVPLRTSSLLYLDYKGLVPLINSNDVSSNDAKGAIENAQRNAKDEVSGKAPKSVKDNNPFSPMQTLMSYFMPQKQKGKGEQYRNFQTTNEEGEGKNEGGDEKREASGIPNSTFLDSAAALFLPPLPSMKYITDPTSRDNVIIHDKVYYEKDLPKMLRNGDQFVSGSNGSSSNGNSSMTKRLLNRIDYNYEELEEQIAREYHKNMSWRKVVVKLKPDAHNNIIVRRRFANAYGWPVIKHLVENHFGPEKVYNKTVTSVMEHASTGEFASHDSLDDEQDLTNLVNRDLMTRQNHEIDETTTAEEENTANAAWINAKDNSESIFALGVAGLLGEVTHFVGDFGEAIFNGKRPSIPLIGQIPLPAALVSPSNEPAMADGVVANDQGRSLSIAEDEIDESGDLSLSKPGVMNNFL
ncbi:uncharacterized protein CPAR2_502430 [Candida parapsilosis]|uniref:DUF676 domain-containing protein n=1 Tax=Candida parapsilosis (strain CDC 317 / ATCC MYA-4646) TaxID=578454 RepID=G8BGM1_CANPC|nr:uncharacterized protein CPAR2_502430 [Candida parapsilosis]CCE44018.1 hypothetical protein CPAR2_502430 [Candida parapsilosis]